MKSPIFAFNIIQPKSTMLDFIFELLCEFAFEVIKELTFELFKAFYRSLVFFYNFMKEFSWLVCFLN